NDVDDDPEAQVVGGGQEGVEVGQRSEPRVDVTVVGDVVAAVGEGGDVEGGQPDRVHAERDQGGQALPDAVEVAFAVAVGVREAADVDLVDDRVAPQVGMGGGRGQVNAVGNLLHGCVSIARVEPRLQLLAQDYLLLAYMEEGFSIEF